MELCLQNVTKQFRNKTAVGGVSITLTQGVWGLIGENGAGKTTLMNMVCGVTRPTAGSILYGGKPAAAWGEGYRALLGYLPQEFGVPQEFSVLNYLAYMAALKGIPCRKAKKKIEELLTLLTLAEYRGKPVKTLSGGTKRRVGIAQALLSNPQILVLDEPTAGLDPGERVKFQALLSRLGADRIVLISTHIVSDIEYTADQIVVMKQGKIVLEGAMDPLLKTLQGKIWSMELPAAQLDSPHAYTILKTRSLAGHGVEARLFSERAIEGAHLETPTLEDVCLTVFDGAVAPEGEA